jgi:uracil-DNA glycosylase family 4
MHEFGFANQATSTHRGDGLELRNAWVSAAVRCAPPANKPLPQERSACAPYLHRELVVLDRVRVIVVLGAFAYDAIARTLVLDHKPKFGHLVESTASRPMTATTATVATGETSSLAIVCSFHPSQQNTFTGRLTRPMLDAVFARARELCAPT